MALNITMRFKSVFVASARRTPPESPTVQAANASTLAGPSSCLASPVAESLSPGTVEASPVIPTPRSSTVGSSTVHFSDSPSDTTHTHRERVRSQSVVHCPQRTNSVDQGALRPRSSSTAQSSNAIATIRVPSIPGYCF
ncbi:hypothetical protein HYPSUDRAFT_204239 [Hypholoma sublateritium FD-334 SS-4]|uniref:Uncharacterized protein n=1 Tax=Hypholoma sublateritium (strain FD-334 SS-4) TaxID=945553 RepID=A0A0D2KZA8_HYPSF|nr:hypothetical protein HYPSUDRAFT_204239 [Hypholoma sublateritium FD-334 SS-4]